MNTMTSLSMSSSTYDDEKECKLNRNYSNASIEILSNDNQISSAFSATQTASKYCSDLSLTMTNHNNNNNNIHSSISNLENETLSIKGYKYHQFISRTLQGHVFIAKRLNGINNNNDDEVVIKTANIKWHQQQITITNDGRTIKIKENMFKEAHFLKIFNHKSCIKYYDFFWDKEQFYLVMEKGKQSLFEFVVDSHKLIDNNKISMNLWINNMVKPIFKQMVDFIHYMHINQSCCNLDISLENIIFSSSASMTESHSNLNIRFIDFGLTQQFKQQDGNNNNDKFVCFDFVGKTQYKSPQIYEKKKFLANKADIWSLGVCLFLLIFGAPPYIEPNKFDSGFLMIYHGKLDEMLKSWGKLKYISSSLYDLLSQMLRYDEDKRIDIVGIKDHEWLKEEEEEKVALNDNGNGNNNINNNISISNEAKTVFIESSNTSNEDSNINAWIATIE